MLLKKISLEIKLKIIFNFSIFLPDKEKKLKAKH